MAPFLNIWKPYLTLLVTVVVLNVLLRLRGRTRRPVPPEMGGPLVPIWLDVSSILDPVCVGGARLEDATEAIPVMNAKTWKEIPFEHVRYYRNPNVGDALWRCICWVKNWADFYETGLAELEDQKYRVLNSFWIWGWIVTLPLTIAAYLGYKELWETIPALL